MELQKKNYDLEIFCGEFCHHCECFEGLFNETGLIEIRYSFKHLPSKNYVR